VTFYLTQTNNEPYTLLRSVQTALSFLSPRIDYEVASWTTSQGQCTLRYEENPVSKARFGDVVCELGDLPPGASVHMDMVVVPQESGMLITHAYSTFGVLGGERSSLTPDSSHFAVEKGSGPQVSVTVEPA
jgi:hypothetical protein